MVAVYSPETDRDLERRVIQFLLSKHRPGLRQLEVSAQQGTVVVRGTVRSFYEKQMCHDICRRVAGVIRLVDEIEVGADELLAARPHG